MPAREVVVVTGSSGLIGAPRYALDTATARTLLGWRAKRSLRDGIPVIAAALERDPVSWYRANGLEPPRRGGR